MNPIDSLYETDFYAWLQEQVKYLRLGKLDHLDHENLIEELESLGKQQRQELRNRLGILLGHLLKWHYQSEGRSKSWIYTIREQRQEIQRHLRENPSLKSYVREAIEIGYGKGLNLVGRETPLDPRILPQSCPFSEFQIFDESIEEH
ncbi:DUF29 domain-containing protein [Candidatus Synechococcus calcipolaris G9]|uniref:DUF29 domain-containing protein n=2 Tax=Synechococcus TaxID=1129 RepID=A0ABT6F3B1_9SYNE|nr:DUF29 domain-containing protein [Candidatus Synechococcus calcipolaris]MDG2992366.1 DUF29 domain-containing protein [Candidatus Synechococcus calcipolaris G9]